MNSSARSTWKEKYAHSAGSYEELLSLDPFEDWDRNVSPEVSAEDEFRCGLEAWLGGNRDQGVEFFQRALRIADRALVEKHLERGLCGSGFPRNRGELLRIKAYCAGLLGGHVDRAALVAASQDMHAMSRRSSEWDSQAEGYCLAAVRAAEVANDTERARAFLLVARAFSWHKEEACALSRLVSESATDSAEGLRRLDDLLERVRDPGYSPRYFFEATMARLELAAISEAAHAGRATSDLKPALTRISGEL